jgi:hypothetical protein
MLIRNLSPELPGNTCEARKSPKKECKNDQFMLSDQAGSPSPTPRKYCRAVGRYAFYAEFHAKSASVFRIARQ